MEFKPIADYIWLCSSNRSIGCIGNGGIPSGRQVSDPFMRNMKGQIGIVILLVSGIVGFQIINEIMTDAANPTPASQGNINLSTGSATLTTFGNGLVPNSQTVTNWTNGASFTEGTHYSIDDDTGVISNLTTEIGVCCKYNITYFYTGDDTFSSSTSRTIATYIVPIGLLGILALAAGIGLLSRGGG